MSWSVHKTIILNGFKLEKTHMPNESRIDFFKNSCNRIPFSKKNERLTMTQNDNMGNMNIHYMIE